MSRQSEIDKMALSLCRQNNFLSTYPEDELRKTPAYKIHKERATLLVDDNFGSVDRFGAEIWGDNEVKKNNIAVVYPLDYNKERNGK